MTRKKFTDDLKAKIFSASRFACAVCQDRGMQIHHIDKDHSNNAFDNLVLLCMKHHDEAHTKRELSANLTADQLKRIRNRWYEKVKLGQQQICTAAGQEGLAHEFLKCGITWGYINHARVMQLLPQPLDKINNKTNFDVLSGAGILASDGLPLSPESIGAGSSYLRSTFYDLFPYPLDTRMHLYFTEQVDWLAVHTKPMHLDAVTWTAELAQDFLRPGQFIFYNKSHYFKKISESSEFAEVRVKTKSKDIEIQYFVKTRDMFGTTSITVSFSGKRSCAAFLQIKSIEYNEGNAILHCTPIALGVGFYNTFDQWLSELQCDAQNQ